MTFGDMFCNIDEKYDDIMLILRNISSQPEAHSFPSDLVNQPQPVQSVPSLSSPDDLPILSSCSYYPSH